MITDLFSITELSNLTHKTRPTIYKYVNSYEVGELNDLPHVFVNLFDLISKGGAKRKDIIKYCSDNFDGDKDNPKTIEIIKLIKDNQNEIDLYDLEKHIKEIIKNGKSK